MEMTKTEQTYIDKSEWPKGPWNNEPDRVSWVDPETGYHCLVRRVGIAGDTDTTGHLCGYVAIERGHPFYGKTFDGDFDVLEGQFNVHGGITYSNACSGDGITGICHTTENNADEAWWLGFDCLHSGDLSPGLVAELLKTNLRIKSILDNEYRDISYCTAEVESLAKQLKELETIRRKND
jgi:hypothetical protein